MTFEKKYPSLIGKGLHNIDIVLDKPLIKRTSHYGEDLIEKHLLDKQHVSDVMKTVRADHWNKSKAFDVEIDQVLTKIIKKLRLE